ncbi:cupin domain-containing protein [Pseudomonas sp. PB3P13]
MNDIQGGYFPYKEFRQSLKQPPLSAKVWKSDALADLRQSLEPSEVDIVSLARQDSTEGCLLTPGMAVSMQWLKPGTTLDGHAHAWWHLFIIQSGSGELTLGDAPAVSVGTGDVLLVPAWNRHGFVNTSNTLSLAMLNISNMPQMAQLSSAADATR